MHKNILLALNFLIVLSTLYIYQITSLANEDITLAQPAIATAKISKIKRAVNAYILFNIAYLSVFYYCYHEQLQDIQGNAKMMLYVVILLSILLLTIFSVCSYRLQTAATANDMTSFQMYNKHLNILSLIQLMCIFFSAVYVESCNL